LQLSLFPPLPSVSFHSEVPLSYGKLQTGSLIVFLATIALLFSFLLPSLPSLPLRRISVAVVVLAAALEASSLLSFSNTQLAGAAFFSCFMNL